MDASQCAELQALLAQSIEAGSVVLVYRRQIRTLCHRLKIFHAACGHAFRETTSRREVDVNELTQISTAHDHLITLLHSFIDCCETSFTVDYWDWPDWDSYFVKNKMFRDIVCETMTFTRLLNIHIPLGEMNDCDWQDMIDIYADWCSVVRDCERAHEHSHSSVLDFLRDHPPNRPPLRSAEASDILILFEIDTSYADSSDDEEENVDDDYASENEDERDIEQRKEHQEEVRKQKALKYKGNFTSSVFISTLKESPVMLKKVGANYCRGGYGRDGVGHGVLGMAVTSQHLSLQPSPFLMTPLAVCTVGVGVTEQDETNEIDSLMSRRQREKDHAAGIQQKAQPFSATKLGIHFGENDNVWNDRPVPRTIGILYPLAPYGCLLNFLEKPPHGVLPKGSRETSIPSRIKLSIMLDICEGLQHLHAHGVLHGRLHTRNVVVCAGYRAKLIDFGVSHLVSPACATGDGLPGVKKGEGFNPRWRAPEDLLRPLYSLAFSDDDVSNGRKSEERKRRGSSLGHFLDKEINTDNLELEQESYALVTQKSDIYSFGMVMYSIAVDGKRPFYNLPWDDTVINTVKSGGRPSFPSWISDKEDFEGIIEIVGVDTEEVKDETSDTCLIAQCWADDPNKRAPLSTVHAKLEVNVLNTLKSYGNVVLDNIDSKVDAINEKIKNVAEEVEAAEGKIQRGRDALKEKEEKMEKMFKPADKKAIELQLEKAYPRLNEAVAKNDALRQKIEDLTKEKEDLLSKRGENEQVLYIKKKLIEKREISNNTFQKEMFVKQFSDYTKPFVIKYLRNACGDTDTLLDSIANEFTTMDKCPLIDEEMWSIVCAGNVFGATSTYFAKVKSLYAYGMNSSDGISNENENDSTVKKKITVDVNKFCDNHNYEHDVRLEFDRRGMLSNERSHSRRNVYFDPSDQVTIVDHSHDDIRETQFLTEGFSPLSRDKDIDKKRKKVRCASHFLNVYEFIARDNTERMFVQELTRTLQFIIAARGDVRDANGMYLKTTGYDGSFVEQIANSGVNFQEDARSCFSTPVHLAASLGHLYSLKFLVDVHKVDCDTADVNGWSPFTIACYNGHLPVVRYLSERHRADMERVDVDGLSPLHIAAMRGHISVLRYLMFRLKHKGDAHYFADKELGGGLLHWACMATTNSMKLKTFDTVVTRHADVVLYLLAEENMDVNMLSNIDGSTPLMWACGAMPHSMTKYHLIETLVENGAHLEVEDQFGNTCLHYAAACGDFLLLHMLVEEFNMDFSKANSKKKIPQDLARGKCAAYLKRCKKVPPPVNKKFNPQFFLKKKTDEVKYQAEPRSVGTYLMKKSPSMMTGWQKRYFAVKGGLLKYYANKQDYDADKTPKGSIDLARVPHDDLDNSISVKGTDKNEIHLLIKGVKADPAKKIKATKDRIFILQAYDNDAALVWVNILKDWVNYVNR